MSLLIPGVYVKKPPARQAQSPHELICQLNDMSEKKTKLEGSNRQVVKCTKLLVPGRSSAVVTSWKFDEFSYGKPERPLPSDARGLFSYTDPCTLRSSIVIRGYDKFFSTDEVAVTKWDRIERMTRGPYDVTLKQNGCIIFIGALPDGTILVTSKHSIGSREDMGESHSERGSVWLRKHLKSAGRTESELAQVLLRNGLTAVCELCDDEFEEHIVPYPPEISGLYLHGLNLNTVVFSTYSVHEVLQFAKYFGFRSNPQEMRPDFASLKALLTECSKTGTYRGTEVEGFVVRTRIEDNDFFFKYKFEEPYLLFRQWREVTKAIISGREPTYKLHKSITKDYIDFVLPLLKDKIVAEQFRSNHGIIGLRQKYLQSRGQNLAEIMASPELLEEASGPPEIDWKHDRFVLVPIATIGCGKTTIASCLRTLFGFGHIQNDNILMKKASFQFAKNIYESFEIDSTRVVVGDRNNHMFHERESLARDLTQMKKTLDPAIHFIALNFKQSSEVKSLTEQRVLQRGDNHQSIRAATMSADEIKAIMAGFHKRFQALDVNRSPDECFCHVLDLDPMNGSRRNLDSVVEMLHEKGLIDGLPEMSIMDTAFETALAYKPEVYKKMVSHPSAAIKKNSHTNGKNKTKDTGTGSNPKSLNLYGLRVNDTTALMAQLEVTPGLAPFVLQLKQLGRVQKELHVTLIHESCKNTHHDVWVKYGDLVKGTLETTIRTVAVVWDDRLMAVEVTLTATDAANLPCVNKYLHITIGTMDATVKPVEANALIEAHHASGGKTANRCRLVMELAVTLDAFMR